MGEYQQWFVEKQDSHQDHSRLRPQAAELEAMHEEKRHEAQLAGEFSDAAGLTEVEHTHLRSTFDIILHAQRRYAVWPRDVL